MYTKYKAVSVVHKISLQCKPHPNFFTVFSTKGAILNCSMIHNSNNSDNDDVVF